VLGQADGIQIVSLGDGGAATVGFEKPIKNGPGFDFAVFENGFIDEFLELAFVEVSSDSINFFRFKATSNTQTDLQMGPFDYNADATLMNNLAGKYRAMYGTPFDLEEMIGIQGLNVDSVMYIKVIDVVGSINPLHASYDQNNHIINEHYPTPFPQGGFDLDAIGVIHQQVNGIDESDANLLILYPNPVHEKLYFNGLPNNTQVNIYNHLGQLQLSTLYQNNEGIEVNNLAQGLYFYTIISKKYNSNGKFVKE
jgi:hypothetical protein